MKIITRIMTTGCAVLVTCALSAQESQPAIGSLESVVTAGTATRQQQLDLARAYITAGRFYEASRIAKGLLDIDPNDAEATTTRDEALRGLHTVAQEKVTAAEQNAARSGATDEDRLALANAYFEAGDYRMAADRYAGLPDSVKNRDTRLRHARALAWTSRLDDAERIYSKVLAEQDTPDVRLEYGRLLSWMGASQSATETLTNVYTQEPTEDAAIALANAQAWSGNREGAIQLLSEFTVAHPESVKAKGLLEQIRTSPDIAIERVDKAIETDPFNLALRMQRARLLYDAGRPYQALKEIEFIREHTRENVEGLAELEEQAKVRRKEDIARLDDRMHALESSGASTSAMTSSSANNADEYLDLAKAFTTLGAYDQAISLYESYLRMRPEDTQARINYARVLGWDRRYTASENQYEKLVRDLPDRPDIAYEHAQILSYSSDYVDAIRTFKRLTDISDNPRAPLYRDVPTKAYFSLGQIYRWYGWNETALEQQNRALALNSSYAPARQEISLVRDRRPASTLGATYGFAEDSSRFEFRRFDVTGQKWVSPRMAYDGSIGRHQFSRDAADVSATAASGGVRYRWQDQWTARARVGANFYDSGMGTRPFWNLGADWLPTIQSRMAFDYNHYDLIYDVFNLTSLGSSSPVPTVGDALDIDDFRAQAIYNTGGFWSLQGDGSYGFVSDNNKRQAAHGLVSFRLLKQPFVAVKGEGRYLSYDRRSNRYWSPTDYKSIAAVLQVGQTLRRFSWNAEVKAGRAFEQSRSSDLRSYVGSVTVPVSSAFDIIGSYGYGKSGRFESVFGTGNDFTNYWQRNWYVGVRLKRLFSGEDQRPENQYYYDNRGLSGSPVLPPVGETH